MNASASPFTPEQRRRNAVLGSLLGLLSLVLMVSFIILFKRNGFPKDPDEWKRLQAQQQAERADQQQAAPAAPPAAPDAAANAERGPR